MKRYLIPILILIILMLASVVLVGCGSTSSKEEAEEWIILNNYLGDFYGLPPVSNTEELQSAAFLVSGFWFEEADKAVKKLQENGIPWERTAPFCYSFNYYVLHDAQLTNASLPLEFMAADHLLADSVKALQDDAEELVRMKRLGEPLKIFPTAKDALESFKEIDKDWERLMEEAIKGGK